MDKVMKSSLGRAGSGLTGRDMDGHGRARSGTEWPLAGSLVHVSHQKHRYYRALNGEFQGDLPGATSVLKAVLGLSKEPLIQWAVGLEREAVLEAAASVRHASFGDKDEFVRAVEHHLGKARAHQKQLEKAADLGTQIHALAEGWLKAQIGLSPNEIGFVPLPEDIKPEAQLAFLAFKDKWTQSGLKPVLMEQPVYDTEWGFAGTIDIVAEHPEKGLGIVDLKSSKGLYQEMHLQVGSYLKAGKNFADLKWAELWRLPKVMGNLEVEVQPLGKLWDRTLTEEQCMGLFRASLLLFNGLVHKEEA